MKWSVLIINVCKRCKGKKIPCNKEQKEKYRNTQNHNQTFITYVLDKPVFQMKFVNYITLLTFNFKLKRVLLVFFFLTISFIKIFNLFTLVFCNLCLLTAAFVVHASAISQRNTESATKHNILKNVKLKIFAELTFGNELRAFITKSSDSQI